MPALTIAHFPCVIRAPINCAVTIAKHIFARVHRTSRTRNSSWRNGNGPDGRLGFLANILTALINVAGKDIVSYRPVIAAVSIVADSIDVTSAKHVFVNVVMDDDRTI